MSSHADAGATRRAMFALALAASAGAGSLILMGRASADPPPVQTSTLTHGTGRPLARVELASCHANATTTTTTNAPRESGDAHTRAAAQRGLSFVAHNATEWQQGHNCFGCHVQAVTLEALTVGRHNQYDVSQNDIDTILRGMLDLPGGAHGDHGLSYHGGSLLEPSKAFGGSAFAHYDRFVDGRVRRELLHVAEELLELQQRDGHVGDYSNGPVAVGPIQTTTQALETWRAAYERSADDRWIAPMRRAEGYVHADAERLAADANAPIENVSYAIVGLANAGASRSETVVQRLAQNLLESQNTDGGWPLNRTAGSAAISTGSALYALRLLGYSDQDRSVTRGAQWLVAHQGEDGGWSHGGSARGEAMWAVLGLVTTDVVSVDVQGIQDGAHVDGSVPVRVRARDNEGGSVERIDVALDDVTVGSQCGTDSTYNLDAATLGDGVHTLDIAAVNARGQTTHRRVQFYAGAFYLTELGSRFEDNGTTFALRDLAPASTSHRVELHVFATRDANGTPTRAAEVFHATQNGAQGPLRFFWNGQDTQGRAQAHARYIAELRFVDAAGNVVQRQETNFVHDTPESQRRQYGEVEGQLDADGRAAIANAQVELVDHNGNVVQTVNSTATGNYRFRGVSGGGYHVRVRRAGFRDAELPVNAAPAAAARAPMHLQAL